jgi:hypothetical protein
MTFDHAQEAFRAKPTNQSAGNYLSTAAEYESDGMIGDDTWLNAVSEVAYWLLYDKQIAQ